MANYGQKIHDLAGTVLNQNTFGTTSPTFTNLRQIQMLAALLASEEEDLTRTQSIILQHNTKAVCTSCGKEDALVLVIRRREGLYEALCRNQDGSGCYPNSTNTLCNYTDPDGVPCQQLAAWRVSLGQDHIRQYKACTDHVGQFLGRASVHTVTPVE